MMTNFSVQFRYRTNNVEMKQGDNPKRGGPNRHQGRKPLSDSERTVTWCAKVTESQREKAKRLGGGSWLRRKIDEEKEE